MKPAKSANSKEETIYISLLLSTNTTETTHINKEIDCQSDRQKGRF